MISIFDVNIQCNAMRVTPPSPLRTAYCPILALRTAYRHFLASRTAYRLTTKTNHFGRFHLHKEDTITVCCMHVQSLLKTLALMYIFFLNFLDFDLPKSMFKFIKGEMTPKKRERSKRAKQS